MTKQTEYKALYKKYYSDTDGYLQLYSSRFNSDEAIHLGINISGNEAFFVVCPELMSLISGILRTDKQVTLVKSELPDEAIRWLLVESLIDEIVITNKIEGVHSSRKEIKDVLESLSQSSKSEKRFEGLINQYVMLGEKNLSLSTCEDLRELYDKLVLSEVVRNNADNAPDGKLFRKDSVNVMSPTQKIIHAGIYPEEKIYEYVQRSLGILNNPEIDILCRTAIFHYLMGYIHPFYDGNGRLSRFISSYYLSLDLDCLIGNRLSYTIQENISSYYKQFKICNEPINKGDLTPFVIMFLEIVQEAENNLLIALSKRRDLYVKYHSILVNLSQKLNWDSTMLLLCDQLLIKSLFSKDGSGKKELLESLGIRSTTTLNTKLGILKSCGLLDEQKLGKQIFYRLKYEETEKILNECE